jgi:beta-lactam-binding protein with PASTA domain
MKRFFTVVLAALSMVAVALVSAFLAMRLAIHGREVEVPRLAGLSVSDATRLASRDGLNLTLEDRFYSTGVPAGRILAQDPAPGSRVRREWAVRVTESLGPQRVSIPDLTGQSERAAAVTIRRLSLDPGIVAHISVPGDPGVVVAQTPPANSGGVDGPRVSLLISDPETAAPPVAYVMPSLLGLTYSAAVSRASAAGLRVVAASAAPAPAPAADANLSATTSASAPPASADSLPVGTSATAYPTGIVTAQVPQPGRRVQRGDVVHVSFTSAAPTVALPPSPQ